jgi:hypothetical protein
MAEDSKFKCSYDVDTQNVMCRGFDGSTGFDFGTIDFSSPGLQAHCKHMRLFDHDKEEKSPVVRTCDTMAKIHLDKYTAITAHTPDKETRKGLLYQSKVGGDDMLCLHVHNNTNDFVCTYATKTADGYVFDMDSKEGKARVAMVPHGADTYSVLSKVSGGGQHNQEMLNHLMNLNVKAGRIADHLQYDRRSVADPFTIQTDPQGPPPQQAIDEVSKWMQSA